MMRLIFSALLLLGLALNADCQAAEGQNAITLDRDRLLSAASFMSKMFLVWQSKKKVSVEPAKKTQQLFQELSFHLNDDEVTDILLAAKILNLMYNLPRYRLSFGQFSILAADLQRLRYCGNVELTKLKTKEYNPARRLLYSVDVFLGGSCNPTTWRADVAIPALKELGISFYNPQVEAWTPELLELENRAKEEARVLFFVMNSETRAVASAIEAAFIAGQNRKQLVLVMHPYKPNQSILNESISQQEYVELKRNQFILRELVTRRGLPVFDDIPAAIQRTKEILADFRHSPSDLTSVLVTAHRAYSHVELFEKPITIEQCQQALLYLGYDPSLVSLDNLRQILRAHREAIANVSGQVNDSGRKVITSELFDFNQFCTISAYLSLIVQRLPGSGCIAPIPAEYAQSVQRKDLDDVYLGGSCYNQPKWCNKLVRPYFDENRISYAVSVLDSITPLSVPSRSMSFYNSSVQLNRALLFLITNDTLSLASTTLAAHCIGLRYNVVLVLQMLPNDFAIGGKKLTPKAIEDYNRGRTYLKDLAQRENVPTFTDIKEAPRYMVEMFRSFSSIEATIYI